MRSDRDVWDAFRARISPSSLDYQEWISIGQILHEAGFTASDWDSWSSEDAARYHGGQCERKWRTFGRSTSKIGVGSLYAIANNHGVDLFDKPVMYGWDDVIPQVRVLERRPFIDGSIPPPPTDKEWRRREIVEYINLLFDRDDYIGFNLSAMQDDDGKWKPCSSGVYCLTAGKVVDRLTSIDHDDDIDWVLASYEQEAGAWIRFNPVDGKGVSNENIVRYRYALVESDTLNIEKQWEAINKLRLPCRCVVHSGGKSLHAIVRIDAVDYKQYRERVDLLYKVCRDNGLDVDVQDRNPSRLSRFPGFMRGSNRQYIVARNLNDRQTFDEWYRDIATDAVDPIETIEINDIWTKRPVLKETLIDGILRRGHKMMVASSSKAGKTFLLIELAIAIAEGRDWLGFKCSKGRVLYIDMELDPDSFNNRVVKVYEALGMTPTGCLTMAHMRGKMGALKDMIPRIVRTCRTGYDAIILDPIYKMGVGDENNAQDVAQFCNSVDRVAEQTGASVIYVHHHSKGAQGAKASMDRASGSGVFARDADAMLDLVELHIDDDVRERLRENDQDDVSAITAFELTSTLREFKRIEPVRLFFRYPLHEVDCDNLLVEAELEETNRAMANGRKLGSKVNEERMKDRKDQFQTLVDSFLDISNRARIDLDHIARDMGLSIKTVRRYAKDCGYMVENGQILRR